MLLLNNVTKKYGNFTALEEVNLVFSGGVTPFLPLTARARLH